jgi:hypothetical protein
VAIPAEIREFMLAYGVRDNEVWPVPGGKSYAVKHSALERIAAEKRIEFMPPQIVEGNTADKTVTLIVYAQMGDIKVWSFGEANPSNNKNAYVWSMAEKRGKDRCILKLLNIHGVLYSGEELDNTERDDAPDFSGDPALRRSSNEIKRNQPGRWPEIERAIRNMGTVDDLKAYASSIRAEVAGWPETWRDTLTDVYENRKDELRARAA